MRTFLHFYCIAASIAIVIISVSLFQEKQLSRYWEEKASKLSKEAYQDGLELRKLRSISDSLKRSIAPKEVKKNKGFVLSKDQKYYVLEDDNNGFVETLLELDLPPDVFVIAEITYVQGSKREKKYSKITSYEHLSRDDKYKLLDNTERDLTLLGSSAVTIVDRKVYVFRSYADASKFMHGSY